MQASEKIALISATKIFKSLPKAHMIAVSSLSFILIASLMLPSEPVTAKKSSTDQTKHTEIAIPALQSLPADFTIHEDNEEIGITHTAPHYRTSSQSVKSGDSLSAIFKRAGLGDREMINLLNTCKECRAFSKLFPGHSFEFSFNEYGALAKLAYVKNKLNRVEYTALNNDYQYETINRKPDVYTAMRSGEITTNLFDAAKQASVSDKVAMEFANIFGWDVDFALDIRKGDTFKIVYEELFLNGERLSTGDILSAEFINQGEKFQAVRFKNSKGKVSYYSPKGASMRKAFLRAPLDFRRISGNFNPKRVHPIFKTIRPHRGTDYAASRGTPVWSPGDGKVVASSFTKANGNYVVIQHGNNIQTKYLHLHKRKVKKGQRVKQKQIIGTVGSTGYSTGPHLHYEFLIGGVHRNPRTVINKLPKAASISAKDMPVFKKQVEPWLAELNLEDRVRQIAVGETDEAVKSTN